MNIDGCGLRTLWQTVELDFTCAWVSRRDDDAGGYDGYMRFEIAMDEEVKTRLKLNVFSLCSRSFEEDGQDRCLIFTLLGCWQPLMAASGGVTWEEAVSCAES